MSPQGPFLVIGRAPAAIAAACRNGRQGLCRRRRRTNVALPDIFVTKEGLDPPLLQFFVAVVLLLLFVKVGNADTFW